MQHPQLIDAHGHGWSSWVIPTPFCSSQPAHHFEVQVLDLPVLTNKSGISAGVDSDGFAI
jgi:hypothetical protein